MAERGWQGLRAAGLFDEEELRYDVAQRMPRAAVPGTGRNFDGLPIDCATAVEELRRAQRAGTVSFVVRKNEFWALDHYADLREVLDTECRLGARRTADRVQQSSA